MSWSSGDKGCRHGISIHAPRAGRDILIEVDGKTVVELDKLNEVYKVNGVDVLAKIKEMC